MKFGQQEIPQSLHRLARERMLRLSSFTPEQIRQHLIEVGTHDMQSLSSIPNNHSIIANRVMRFELKKLVDEGKVKQLKKGVWIATRIMDN